MDLVWAKSNHCCKHNISMDFSYRSQGRASGTISGDLGATPESKTLNVLNSKPFPIAGPMGLTRPHWSLIEAHWGISQHQWGELSLPEDNENRISSRAIEFSC